MLISKHLGTASALALILGTQTAFADVTAQDIWSDWRGYLEGMGYSVDANESSSSGVLTVSDITMSMVMPDDEGTVAIELDTISFAENGDGTVSIQFPETMPIKITGAVESGSPATAQIDYSQSGFNMVASGAPDDVTYTYSADRIAMALASLNVEGENVSEEDVRFRVDMADIAGTHVMKTADVRTYNQASNIGTISYELDVTDRENDGRGAFKGTINGVTANGNGTLPLVLDSSDVAAMFKDGFAFDGSFDYQSGSSEFNVQDPVDGNFSGTTSSQGGSLAASMDGETLSYDVTSRNSAINVTGAQIPFGLSATMDETLFKLSVPIAKSDEEQDFGLAITLGNFAMDDTLWNMFDPSGALPRDPATINIDLAGKAKVLVDFMDPDATAAMEASGTVPGELNSLELRNLLVSVAGAALSGKGSFTFDNTQEFNGMPKPTGSVHLKLVGGNGLIDKLVGMGMLPEEQAMGARMMMGLFAVPGEGADTLNSKIEINDQGHVLANGQRIQ
jgi:hypothetical protein